MSSETIVTALFLISAVIAAGVLINAIFPAIYKTADTFGSVSSEADIKMRTDFKIVNAYAVGTTLNLWLKNVGTNRIHENELKNADIYIEASGDIERISVEDTDYTPIGDGNNLYWDPGETLSIETTSTLIPASGGDINVIVVLPSGIRRSESFTSS